MLESVDVCQAGRTFAQQIAKHTIEMSPETAQKASHYSVPINHHLFCMHGNFPIPRQQASLRCQGHTGDAPHLHSRACLRRTNTMNTRYDELFANRKTTPQNATGNMPVEAALNNPSKTSAKDLKCLLERHWLELYNLQEAQPPRLCFKHPDFRTSQLEHKIL